MRQLLIPATVTLVNRLPTAVSWSRRPTRPQPDVRSRRQSPRRVVRVVDQWRYDGRWWEPDEVHRDYFFLELERGLTLEIFREGEEWWVARLND